MRDVGLEQSSKYCSTPVGESYSSDECLSGYVSDGPRGLDLLRADRLPKHQIVP